MTRNNGPCKLLFDNIKLSNEVQLKANCLGTFLEKLF